MTEAVDILIVGAGPTGLGAAWRLDAAGVTDWLVCEAADDAGGLAGSVLDEHGFTWDLGGHVQFSHYQYFDDLMDDLLGADGWLYHDRESWVWLCERFVPYPFQLNLHRLPEAERAAALRGLISAVRQAATAGREPAHFDAWIAHAFGEGIAEIFLRPYNRKVWAFPLDSLSWRWIGDRVATVDLPRLVANIASGRDDVSWGPNSQFRFPRRGGTGAIWRTLVRRLADRHPLKFRFAAAAEFVDTAHRRVRFSDGRVVAYERLITTIPLDEFIRLSDLSSSLGESAAALRYSSTHVVGIGLVGRQPEPLHGKCWMYFPEANCPFYRVTVFSHYSPHNVPDIGRYWSLMAEVSESAYKPVDRGRVANDVVDGLIATGLVERRDDVHHVWHRRLEHGYPTPSLGRDRALQVLLPTLDARGVFSRGRFGAWKYEVSNQDHSFAQGVEVVDRLLADAEEETVNHPERVNARRSVPRAVAGR